MLTEEGKQSAHPRNGQVFPSDQEVGKGTGAQGHNELSQIG